MLAPILGKPMIQWVWEACSAIKWADTVVITDDRHVKRIVESFGGVAELSRKEHENGSDRIKELVIFHDKYRQYDTIVNVQADEPLITTGLIKELLSDANTKHAQGIKHIVTYARVLPTHNSLFKSRDVVKVVTGNMGEALYFSREPIAQGPDMAFQHIGIYAYPRDILCTPLPISPMEQRESLEQLRYLYYGFGIDVLITDDILHGVDTPHDVAMVEEVLKTRM